VKGKKEIPLKHVALSWEALWNWY